MPKKYSPRSIEGFVPQSNGPRRVGFDGMVNKPPQKVAKRRSTAPEFPSVGQTLATYRPSIDPNRKDAPSPFNLTLDDEPKKGKKAHHGGRIRRFFRWKRIVAIVFLIIFLVGGWLGYKFIYNASKTFHGNLLGILSTAKLKGEDTGRVNVLVAGNSADDTGHGGADLTDSIMVLSLDTKNNTAFMLSVPRDLWVNIPGFGHAKINEAYVDGEAEHFSESGYFPGGMGLLQQVVQKNFGLTLNYYALINYTAMRDMVDAVGGITVNIQSTDPRGLYDPSIDFSTHGPLVKLTNGTHTLDGEQALDLARARGDAYGSYGFPSADFNRTANQRMMMLALKSKIISANVLANPVTVSKLTDAVGSNVKTNMSLSEARRAYDLSKNISNIQSIGLNSVDGKNLLANYAAASGESALIPAAGIDDFSDIQTLIQRLTSNNPIVREGAKVVVLNATNTSGLASSAELTLNESNVNVVATGNATATQAKTTIISASSASNTMAATKQLLTKLYGNNVTTVNPYSGVYNADFIILIGQDKVPATPSTSTTTGG